MFVAPDYTGTLEKQTEMNGPVGPFPYTQAVPRQNEKQRMLLYITGAIVDLLM
jgi:hypothetical protein